MALQNFVDKAPPAVSAAWLNVVDKQKFTVFGDAVTKAAVRTALTTDVPFEPANGGTGLRAFDAAALGNLLWPRTGNEIAISLVPNLAYDKSDIRRYNVVPNDNSQAVREANTTALRLLLSPEGATTFSGLLNFTNTTGNDTYYFAGHIQVKEWVTLDFNWCHINFSKVWDVTDNLMGFFTFVRHVRLRRGYISATYNGTLGAGQNPGMLIRMGSRPGYRYGTYVNGIFDTDDLVANNLEPMGDCHLEDLVFTSTNPDTACSVAVLLLGGLFNCTCKNLTYEGAGGGVGPSCFIYYEFGHGSVNGFPSQTQYWTSTHAHNLVFQNITGRNLTVTTGSYMLDIVEAIGVLAENIHADGAYGTFQWRPGEAHFYRVDPATNAMQKRCVTMKNITGINLSGIGASLVGAQPSDNGMFSDTAMDAAVPPLAHLTVQQKTDLMIFSLDGFAFSVPGGVGVKVSGACEIKNGSVRGCVHGLHIEGDINRFDISNVEVRDNTGIGIRASDAGTITTRKKSGEIKLCRVAGNVGAGIALDACDGVEVKLNTLGYLMADDGVAETTQTAGISVSTAGYNVNCDNNRVYVSSGSAYATAGTGDRGNNVVRPRGTVTRSGTWKFEGASLIGEANLALVADPINTQDKYIYKRNVSSNNRELIATGAAAADTWKVIDGATTVTPV